MVSGDWCIYNDFSIYNMNKRLAPSQIRVPFQDAAKLNLMGYQDECTMHYDTETGELQTEPNEKTIPAPLVVDIVDWLEDVAGIRIAPSFGELTKQWFVNIHSNEGWLKLNKLEMPFEYQIDAMAAGISILLQLIRPQ